MKLTKSFIKQLIREAIDDPSIAGSRMSGEEVYHDEERYREGEQEENEVIRELEDVITGLMNVKRKLELAQKKENK